MSINYSSLLNEAQLAAVTTGAQYVRIIAGAGSGKTRVLTYRMTYLIDEVGVDPSRILAVTFTNKAAREMSERIGKLVPDAAPYLHVSTFHSFCSRFLRVEAHRLGYPRSFIIFDDDDQQRLVKNVAAELGFPKTDPLVKAALKYIGSKKTDGLYPEDIEPYMQKSEDERQCLKMYQMYEEKKTEMLAFDFDDLILQTIKILKECPDARERWANRFDHILVDEYQDTNDVQYTLLKLLMTDATCLCVVGDPDQTIYTWRGANQKIILNFPIEFKGCQDIILAENYRSTKNILDAANRLIAFNKKRVKKDLFTVAAEGEPVKANRFESADEEAEWVISKICELATQGEDFLHPIYDNIAVLYRSSYMTRVFEQKLAASRIPYRIFGGLRFYQRKEVKDILAYFRLFITSADDISFERIINVPKRGIGPTSVGYIRDAASSLGLSMYDFMRRIDEFPGQNIPPKVIKALRPMIAKIEETKAKLTANYEAYSGVLHDFVSDIGYFDYLKEDEELDEDRIANVNALFDDVTSYLKEHPESTFDEYLQNVSIVSSQDDMNGGNYVSLMTIHVAKGLEFDNVFIICMNEGSFPSFRAEQDAGRDGMEEERRLCYVAMTRAKRKLFMTSNSGYSYVTDSRTAPSKFFEEAGIKLPNPRPTLPSQSGYANKNWDGSTRSWGQKKVYGEENYFSDGDAISPFEKKPEPKQEERPADNGITHWGIGDGAHHEKFGDGIVTKIIDKTIIVVNFDGVGEKTLLSTHPMLSKRFSKGGQA